MTTFGYSTVDFGWDNSDSDHFRSFIEVIPGNIETPRRRFAFPGVNAEFVQSLGVRGRGTTWLVDMVADARSYLTAFEDAMESLKKSGRTYGLYERGDFYDYVLIESFERRGPLVALQSPWAWGQQYVIQYRRLP